ncbi:MAG: hypothetical protein JSR59_02485 [Proteobacteria bacterium]|nr:hypothetical protein [Pseudomonadota bacterium]
MLTEPAPAPTSGLLPLLAAADFQDNLMTASNDLDRLQTLLAGACDGLMQSFHGAIEGLDALRAAPSGVADMAAAIDVVVQRLGGAVVALQFQDMASQLINHTQQRLRNTADRIACDAMGDDGDGMAIIEQAPLRPNPVTQDEMDAGSVDLF